MALRWRNVVTKERHGCRTDWTTMRELRDRDHAGPASAQQLLRCVWTAGSIERGDRCQAHVPAVAALEAWRDEIDSGTADWLFHFCWGGGQWSGYGAPGGAVGGVYCPSHSGAGA